ncbi:MAG: hypothetical protein QXO55_07745 [Candidatus Korarchaeum sp.]
MATTLLQELLGGRGHKYRALSLVAERGEVTREELAKSLEVSPQAASLLIRELVEMFLVEESFRGPKKIFRVTTLGMSTLRSIKALERDLNARLKDDSTLRLAENRLRRLTSRLNLLNEERERLIRAGRNRRAREVEAEISRTMREIELVVARMRKLGISVDQVWLR